MSAGAVIIHDSLLWDPRFDSITHPSGVAWTDTEYLLTPQLQPKAQHASSFPGVIARMDINFSSAIPRRGDHALVLAGTNIPDHGLDRMVRVAYGLGGTFSSNQVFDPHIVRHVDGSWHMVFLSDRGETASFDVIRVTWDAASFSGAVGGVYPGRYRQAPELADRGWEILGPDDNTSSKAAGGQIYKAHASPQINRELRVPMGLVRSQAAMGSPVSQRVLQLPAPNVSGTSLIQSGGFVYTSAPTSQGTVTFSELFSKLSGEYARVDYSAYFRSNNSTGAINDFRWSIDDHEMLNGPLRGARGSAIIRIDADDLVLRAETGNPSNAHAIRVDRVSLIPAPDNFQWGPDDSLLGIYMRHGNSRPVFVMQRPSDPIINQATGMYGYLQGVPGITHRQGPYFGSRLVVGEQR